MPSVKVVIKNKTYKDGTTPVFLRILANRNSYYKKLFTLDRKNFDKDKGLVKSGESRYREYNLLIKKEIAEANSYIVDCELRNVSVNPKAYFNNANNSDILYELLIAKYETENNFHTSNHWKTTANKIKAFDSYVTVDMVDISWVNSFDKYMKVKLSNNANTRERNHRNVRHFCPKAYELFEMPKNETVKEKLTLDEVNKVEEYQPGNRSESLAKDLFLFSLYNRGIRVSDLFTLKPNNIIDGGNRLRYKMTKGERSVVQNIKLGSRSKAIVAKYKGGKYLFPVLKEKHSNDKAGLKRLDARNSYVRKHLKNIMEKLEIDKNISMHSARHTFAYLLKKEKSLSTHQLQGLLGHSSHRTTEIYTKSLFKDEELDEATDGFFD